MMRLSSQRQKQDKGTLSVSGGTNDGVKYCFLEVCRKTVFIKTAEQQAQYNFRSNIDAKITDFLQASADLSGRQEDRVYHSCSRYNLQNVDSQPNLWLIGPRLGSDIENETTCCYKYTATGHVNDVNNVFQVIRERLMYPG
jgi:hypothetical protein